MLIEKHNNIWFKVPTSSGFKYANYTTGEQVLYCPDETDNIIISDNLKNIFTLVGTTDDNKLVVENIMIADMSAPLKGAKKRDWIVISTFIYDKDKTCISKDFDLDKLGDITEKYPNTFHVRYYNRDKFWAPAFIIMNTNMNNPDCIQNHMTKVFGTYICNMAGNKSLVVDNSYNFLKFLKFTEPKKSSGKKQQLIDKLVSLTAPIENIPVLASYKRANAHMWDDNTNGFAIVDKINGYDEPCVCLRTFSVCGTDFTEGNRIYITKKDYVVCKKTIANGYVTANAQAASYWMYPLTSIDKEACKGTMLEYFSGICDDFNPKVQLLLLIIMVQNKWIEQLYKAGFTNIVHDLVFNMQGSSRNIKTVTDHYFYGINSKEKKMNNIIGLSSTQLAFINDRINPNHIIKTSADYIYSECDNEYGVSDWRNNDYKDYKTTSIRTLKLVFGEQNIAHVDEKTFKDVFSLLTELNLDECGYNYMNNIILSKFVKNWGIQNLLSKQDMIKKINNQEKPFVPGKGITLSGGHYVGRARADILFRDYVNMVESQDFARTFKADFKDYDGLVKAHDAVALVYEAVINKEKTEAFLKNSEKLKKFIYEDDEFAVIVPERPEELAIEGMYLHHCVKSYIDKVCNGTTGIMFIREKAAIDVPFFTAEVQNGYIMQIHGLCNSNVSSNPKVLKFVTKWINEAKLKTSKRGFDIVR